MKCNNELNIDMPDIQNYIDTRHININKVGIKDIKTPITILNNDKSTTNTVVTWTLTVGLPGEKKGTHMSRFISILESYKNIKMNQTAFTEMSIEMIDLLEAPYGEIEAKFVYFLNKEAPVSKTKSLMNYDVVWRSKVDKNKDIDFELVVSIPVTSLCPCSKAISNYGAHNQRSNITVSVKSYKNLTIDIEELIYIVEQEASCELWSLLKRPDEKYVTEKAYNNPKFVEDLVRDIAVKIMNLSNVDKYKIEAENYESIHNHSAYALIEN